ncbi:MAG: multicopper oxidase family protein [Gammaproteobacteria bacterium]|nr:multicopper oxidase family protein [Gammaproteobacteria bacterium]
MLITQLKEWTERLLPVALASLLCAAAQAAAPGITGAPGTPAFNLIAEPANINQPDGNQVYSWGYGCNPAAPAPGYVPAAITNAKCPAMQIPGPTLVVTEGDSVTVNLTNNLPTAAGNTSILFPGFQVKSVGGTAGLLTQEAAPGGTVTYTFTATSPGTRTYYSGTQGDLQIEMGLYGVIIVLPKSVPAACTSGLHAANLAAEKFHGEKDFRLADAAYDNPKTCYDREYLFQFSTIDPTIHQAALAQVNALAGCVAGAPGCNLQVPTEPYHPAYFLINGRSMPDDMDPNYAPEYPNQPYNGDPHVHPGEQLLLRIVGQDHWQHPFHEHANHVRILARDGNLILSQVPGSNPATVDPNDLAGPALFTTTTTPGLAMDGIFYWTGRGLNWDAYGHNPKSTDPLATLPCTPDANGYNTGFAATDTTYSGTLNPAVVDAVNYYEWCADHNKPLEAAPVGDVASGGPATLPNPNILTNGAWYSGSPYLGPNATVRATGPNSSFQPANTQANPADERGFAYMWHSHNEREITTNNVFPGGMFMILLVDSREFVIDETK